MADKRADIARRVAADIKAGVYPVGSTLPTLEQIGRQYGGSMNTATAALALLRQWGMVRSRQGGGRAVVLDWRATRNLRDRQVDRDDRGYYMDTKSGRWWPIGETLIGWEPADHQTAELLDVEPESEVLIRRRLLGTPSRCEQISRRAIPAEVARATELPLDEVGLGQGVVLDRVEERFGALDFADVVYARLADREESKALMTSPGSPLLVVATVASAEGRPLMLTGHSMDAARWAMRYPLQRVGEAAGE